MKNFIKGISKNLLRSEILIPSSETRKMSGKTGGVARGYVDGFFAKSDAVAAEGAKLQPKEVFRDALKTVATACFVLIVSSCGGSSDSTTGISTSTDSQALAVSMMGSGISSSEGAVSEAGSGSQGIASSVDIPQEKARGMVNLVAMRAIHRAKAMATSPAKTVTASDDFTSFVFTDEEVSNPSGGNAILNGTLSDTIEETESTFRLNLDGDLTALLNEWASAVSLEDNAYTETLSGSLALAFDGYVEVKIEGTDTTITANINSEVTSSDMDIAGSVSGSGSLNMTVTVSGDATSESELSSGCSGTATVTTSAHGAETCSVSADCSGCS